jgi:hypothetical protein
MTHFMGRRNMYTSCDDPSRFWRMVWIFLSWHVFISTVWMDTTISASNVECQIDGTCTEDYDDDDHDDTAAVHSKLQEQQCGLYMAESSIQGAGWGVYTGRNWDRGVVLDMYSDVVIQYIDLPFQSALQKKLYNIEIPKVLLREYFWRPAETDAYFDSNKVDSVSPGFGMLANCALGLVNHEQSSCRTRSSGPRSSPTAGASSTYQDCHFNTIRPIPAGHELFDNYGDDWFETRSELFGDDIAYTDDFTIADAIVELWQHEIDGKDHNLASDLWDMVIVPGITPHLTKGSRRALPHTAIDARKVNFNGIVSNTVAYQTLNNGIDNSNVIRSIEWLDENGMCLDHIKVQPISIRNNQERGAFARRHIAAGTMVAPAPVVHLSRKHTDLLLADLQGEPNTVLWKGHQLLLNYCYGHPSSSILLFPFSHGVNLINHPNPSYNQTANVGIRWSDRMTHPEWLNLSATELIHQHNSKSGLMMEFYARTDIREGDEIFFDYGNAWQEAWDRHVELWNYSQTDSDASAVHSENYISAWDYNQQCNKNITQNASSYSCLYDTPSWIEVRCWIDEFIELELSTVEWLEWAAPKDSNYNESGTIHGMIDETLACQVLSVVSDLDENKSDRLFRIRVQKNERSSVRDGWNVTNVPRSAITMVDRPYTSNQFLRQAFRREIQLPDEMVPPSWRDLEPDPDSSCGLYMAESSIPHSGLGMYTAKEFSKGDKLFYGDVVIQVEDIDLNTKLRHWVTKDFEYKENEWLLNNYYWSPMTSIGLYDAADIESIIPGLGMLANSHTGLVNAIVRAPTRFGDLHRGLDPATGSSTTYHNIYFDATKNIGKWDCCLCVCVFVVHSSWIFSLTLLLFPQNPAQSFLSNMEMIGLLIVKLLVLFRCLTTSNLPIAP